MNKIELTMTELDDEARKAFWEGHERGREMASSEYWFGMVAGICLGVLIMSLVTWWRMA